MCCRRKQAPRWGKCITWNCFWHQVLKRSLFSLSCCLESKSLDTHQVPREVRIRSSIKQATGWILQKILIPSMWFWIKYWWPGGLMILIFAKRGLILSWTLSSFRHRAHLLEWLSLAANYNAGIYNCRTKRPCSLGQNNCHWSIFVFIEYHFLRSQVICIQTWDRFRKTLCRNIWWNIWWNWNIRIPWIFRLQYSTIYSLFSWWLWDLYRWLWDL